MKEGPLRAAPNYVDYFLHEPRRSHDSDHALSSVYWLSEAADELLIFFMPGL